MTPPKRVLHRVILREVTGDERLREQCFIDFSRRPCKHDVGELRLPGDRCGEFMNRSLIDLETPNERFIARIAEIYVADGVTRVVVQRDPNDDAASGMAA
jgi:hypothetical protein